MVMATQAFVSDMQALNPIQQIQPASHVTQSGGPTAVQQSGQVKTGGQGQSSGQTTTIIQQPTQTHSGQQFIVTNPHTSAYGLPQYYYVSGDPSAEQVQDSVQIQQGNGQVVYQPQYVDASSSDSSLYAASNGQIQTYSEYNQGATMYTPVSGTYYQSANTGQNLSGLTHVGGLQGHILTQQGGTYLLQGGTIDGEGHPLAHTTTRASPATDANSQRNAHFDVKCWQREVQWLIDNYETAEGVSLPRSTLYNHYLRHCQEQKIDPMNPASFGKLIRSVFLGLRTRRLGTRGNSKYHYYGIRIKSTSPLNQYTDDHTMALRQQPIQQGKRFGKSGDGSESQDGSNIGSHAPPHHHQQFLGDASAAIPNFQTIELGSDPLPDGVDHMDIAEFEELYKEHCEAILDIVINLQFSLIEALWQSFWRNIDNEPDNGDLDEHRLSKNKLYAMCRMPQVQKFVRHSDYCFYQALVEVLIPDVLRPIPSSLTQAIRNFAKSLETWLKSSTEGIPEEMVKTKLAAVSAFAQTLRRYTSLNHLAQAARAVLQNTTQINQMLTDLNRVDFTNVQEQASWVCQCDDEVVHQLEQDFKKTLQQQNSLEQWAQWLEGVVQQVLKPHEGSENFPKAARQFLLKWSFYSSMVIRDLTLRSAASFGSFHLIRLLYDEYMFYLVEHKVANATGESPIAVMGEVRQFADLGPVMSMGTQDAETKPTVTVNSTNLTTVAPTTTATLIRTVPTMNGQANTQTITTLPKSIVMAPGTVLHRSNLAALSNQVAHTVLTGNSNQTGHTHSLTSTGQVVSQVHTLINNPSTVSVLTSAGSHQPKTIVVVPVSATTGSGDSQPTKKLKTI